MLGGASSQPLSDALHPSADPTVSPFFSLEKRKLLFG
jgi:hypothetical protein